MYSFSFHLLFINPIKIGSSVADVHNILDGPPFEIIEFCDKIALNSSFQTMVL